MPALKFLYVIILVLFTNSVYAVNKDQFHNHKDAGFVENKGQLSISDIKYYYHEGSAYLYCKPGVISFVFTKTEQEDSKTISEATGLEPETAKDHHVQSKSASCKITINHFDLLLIGSDLNAQITSTDEQNYYENLYLVHSPEEGITNLHTYKTVTYKNVYPNIDMVLHCKECGIKYEFVINPGGKISNIQLQWNGLNAIKKRKDGGISYSFALGNMQESKPITYQDINEIPSAFAKIGNRISFRVWSYNKDMPLVIDPTLLWATYYGSSNEDIGYSVGTDDSENVYIGGVTFNSIGIATSGAYQTSYSGSGDAFLAKFNSAGNRLWATYYGGNGSDLAFAVNVDVYGDVYISGATSSTNSMATSGAYQTSIGGIKYDDAFLAKFNNSGKRLWATYFGGILTEYASGIGTDISGNVYITGTTASNVGIATAGAFQTYFGAGGGGTGGAFDAFLAKFSRSGNLLWSTYYGYGEDNANGVSTDPSGNVYLAGTAESSTGIATSGAYRSSLFGNNEAFLVKFNSSGSRVWGTYFGGGNDQGLAVSTDISGNVYLAGQSSNNGINISTAGAYQTSYGGGTDDAFLAKFSSSGSLNWATYFGGNSVENAAGVSTDHYGNVYITGWTQSRNGVATSGSFQTSHGGGGSDAFLAQFGSSGSLIWSTYYGGKDSDAGNGVTTDVYGNIYMTGRTYSLTGIATSKAFQPLYAGGVASGENDAFLVKFGVIDAGIVSILPKDSFCPGSQTIKVTLKNFGTEELISVDIDWSINGKVQKPFKWGGTLFRDSSILVALGDFPFQPGIDTIWTWTSNPNGRLDSFPKNDSAMIVIKSFFLPKPIANAGPDTTLCYDETYTMQGSGGITYLWTPAKYLSNDTIADPIATLPNTQRYMLYVRNKYGCEDSAQVLLTVKPKLRVKISGGSSPVCNGTIITLIANASGGDSLHYSFNWPYDSTIGKMLTTKINASGWYKVTLNDNCSRQTADSFFIDVIPKPVADFIVLNQKPYRIQTAIKFQNKSKQAYDYLWIFGDNDSSIVMNPEHIYQDSGTYKITLISYSIGNCSDDTVYSFIHIINDELLIYIPNAFTPDGNGINDIFNISGVGIASYRYSIYNRWGEELFNSTATNHLWDGTFKNVPVMEGVYIYQLDVTDISGNHHYLSGNITLMR